MRENIGKLILVISCIIIVVIVVLLVFGKKQPTYTDYYDYDDGRDGAVITSYNINLVGLEWLPEGTDTDKMISSCKDYLDSIGITEDVTVSIEDYVGDRFTMQEYNSMTYFYISSETLEIINLNTDDVEY